MKPSVTSSQVGSNATPRRVVDPRALLVVAGIVIVVLVGVLVAMVERGAPGRPEEAAPGREVLSQRAPGPTERTRVPRPALPQAPANAALLERPSARAETKLVLTQIKVQKYVEEAYPAWLRAHPGQTCPRQLTELNEYTEDTDTNDAWGRPLKMRCGTSTSGNRIKVISYGRDGEVSEDDIRFGE